MNPTARSARALERRAAWSAAKEAVRSYARNPTEINAGRVEIACRQIKETQAPEWVGHGRVNGVNYRARPR